mmetsp:Transcript_72949/g.225598  ORF Transcript_72949/g.225598 Transcript_72949/m.225598 type:complete len:302 (-) Transcript_72949:32-937(-)
MWRLTGSPSQPDSTSSEGMSSSREVSAGIIGFPGAETGDGGSLASEIQRGASEGGSGSSVVMSSERGLPRAVPAGVAANMAERAYGLARSGKHRDPEARICSSMSSNSAPGAGSWQPVVRCACDCAAAGLKVVWCDGGLDRLFRYRLETEDGKSVPTAGFQLATVIMLHCSESSTGPKAGSMSDFRVCPGASCHMTASWSQESNRTVSSSMPSSRTLLSGPIDSATFFQKAGTAESFATCCSASAKAEAVMPLPLDASKSSRAASRNRSSSATLPWGRAGARSTPSAPERSGAATIRATSV